MLPCIVPRCHCKAEAAHIGMTDYSRGIVESGHAKPNDFMCLPCCAHHHRDSNEAEHVTGTEEFWRRLGVDPFPLAKQLYIIHKRIDEDMEAIERMRNVVLRARFNADL